MSREVMKQALDALELAGNSHGIMLLSDPPQDAWKTRRVNESITAAIATLRAALAEQPAAQSLGVTDRKALDNALFKQPAAPVVLTDAEIVRVAGEVQAPINTGKTAIRFARAILAAAIPPGHVVVKDEPVAWLHRPKVQRFPDKPIVRGAVLTKPSDEQLTIAEIDGDEYVPLYAARQGGSNG